MENDYIYNTLIDSKLPDNAFREEYDNQQLDNNIGFNKWKNNMIKKYGIKAKLFRCQDDNILFYTSNEDCKSYPFYQSNCPCCGHPICYFCHRYVKNYDFKGNCCLRRTIYYLFYKDGIRLIAPIGNDKDNYKEDIYNNYLYFFIPGLNLFGFISTIHYAFYYDLALSNEPSTNGFIRKYYDRYYDNHNIIYILFRIDDAFSFILTLPFIILNMQFIIILLIISIPFKFYPMKYYIGLAYGRL